MRMRRWFWGMGLTAALSLMALTPVTPVQAADTAVIQVKGIERVKAVAAAGETYAALRADGTVWIWDSPTAQPQQITASCPVRSLAVGDTLVAMLCPNGSVYTASIAIDEAGVHRTAQAPGLESIKSVSMGRTGLVALKTDGTVWVADFAISEAGVHRAVQVEGLSGVASVAAGIDSFVAVLSDGTARTAALAINSKGTSVKRLDDLPSVRSVSVCGPDGDCDDTDPFTFVTGGGKLEARAVSTAGVKRVAIGDLDGDGYGDVIAGHGRTLLVTPTGDVTVAVTGVDGKGEVTTVKKPGPAFKQVAAGSSYDMGLTADGSVWMWSAPVVLTQVPGLTGIKAIASAGQWNLALAADGTLSSWSWGANQRTYVIPHVLEVRQMAATPDAYFLLYANGMVATGKWPAAGALPAEPVIHRDLAARAISAGDGHVILIKFDGTAAIADVAIDEEGVHFSEFRAVPGVSGGVQLASGTDGYLLLRDDGTVWGARWGAARPEQVKEISGAQAVAAGDSSLMVLMGDGSVRTIAIDEPGVHVWGDPHVEEADGIAAGGSGGVILLCDGSVMPIAAREAGSGLATGRRQYVAVSAGTGHNLALAADGTVWHMIQVPAASK